jgi:hypothetical protein
MLHFALKDLVGVSCHREVVFSLDLAQPCGMRDDCKTAAETVATTDRPANAGNINPERQAKGKEPIFPGGFCNRTLKI